MLLCSGLARVTCKEFGAVDNDLFARAFVTAFDLSSCRGFVWQWRFCYRKS